MSDLVMKCAPVVGMIEMYHRLRGRDAIFLLVGSGCLVVGVIESATDDLERGLVAIVLGVALLARILWVSRQRLRPRAVANLRATGFRLMSVGIVSLVVAISGVTGLIPPRTGGPYLFIPLVATGAGFLLIGVRALRHSEDG